MAQPFGRMNWTCGLACVRGTTITEYDLEAAGLSVLRERGLVSPTEGERLAALPKERRLVEVGLLCRDDEKVLTQLEAGTREAVVAFCRENELTEEDLVSIKRDAVYTMRPARRLRIGEHLNFREKGRFSSYFNLSGVEMYYSGWTRTMTVKGLGGEVEEAHRGHMIEFIRRIVDPAENLRDDHLLPLLAARRAEYVGMRAERGCYREMSANNGYRLLHSLPGLDMYVDAWPGDDQVDISFNYTKFLVPLIAALV
jgi:hypothetical protein